MASPFELFRKNQKTLLSLLLIFAMFAFILADMLTGDSLNLPMLGLVLGAAIFTVVGWTMGRPIPYATGGALGGLLAGWIMVQTGASPGSQYALETNIGNLTPIEFEGMVRQRAVVNDFIMRAQQAAGTNNQMGGISFSQQLEQDIALRMIFRDLAERNGIRVDKEAVKGFIASITTPPPARSEDGESQDEPRGTQLTKEDYSTILSDLRISDSQLTRALKSELLAVAGRQQFYPRPIATPQQYWESYRKMNLMQNLQVVAVPVSAFADSVADPGDSVLQAYFEEHKSTFSPTEYVPGFYQPRKIQLAYLEASYRDIEQTIPAITDEQIKQHYEANKETLYLNRTVPDDGPSFPGSGNSSVPVLPDFEDLKDTAPDVPEDSVPDSDDDQPDAGKQNTDKSPAVPDADEDTAPNSDEVPKQAEGEADDCLVDESPTDPPANDEENSDPSTKNEESKSGNEPPLVAPTGEESAADDAPLIAPKPAPKYRPLDESLRIDIEEQLLTDATKKKQLELLERAQSEMAKLSRKYFDATILEDSSARQKAVDAFVTTSKEQLKAFAKKTEGVNYEETQLMNYTELSESGEHPVGGSLVTSILDGRIDASRNETSVTDQFFSLPPESLYEPQVSHTGDSQSSTAAFAEENLYVVWKTADAADHEPSFSDTGVRKQVLAAWKIEQARPLAEKRAQELEEQLKETTVTWSEHLDGLPDGEKTVTGEIEGVTLSTRITESFSWIRQESVPTQTMFGTLPIQRPVLSEISAVEQVDGEFMNAVFNDMDEGDVGVIPNSDKSYYYVVQVRDRRFRGQLPDSGLTAEQSLEAQYNAFLQTDLFASQMFSPSPYSQLAQADSSEIANNWLQALFEQYEVKFNASAQ